MGKRTHGPQLLIAVETNDHRKVHEILAISLRSKDKIKDVCTSDIKRLATDQTDCPLIVAATLEDPSILKYFIGTHEINVNYVHQKGTGRRTKTTTVLLTAAKHGLCGTVDAILSFNADLSIQDHKGRSALHFALARADYRMAKMLLARGAQPNLADIHENTPMHIATKYGHVELVKLLIQYCGDLYKKDGDGAIPIHIAAKEGHVPLVRLFCLHEVNVNIKVPCYEGAREKAPLHVAAEQGHFETVLSLLEQLGADVNMRDSEGESPLHCAVLNECDPYGMKSKDDFTETVHTLLEYGAVVNGCNGRGETPLHLAARNEFQKVVDLLVDAGADPLVEDNDKNKPIDLVTVGDTVTAQMLKKAAELREQEISEVLEMEARGFTTSLAKPVPVRANSTSNMATFPGGRIGRATSTPGLFMSHKSPPMSPGGVYAEDGYLNPLGPRGRFNSLDQGNFHTLPTDRVVRRNSSGRSSGTFEVHNIYARVDGDTSTGAETSPGARGSRRRSTRRSSEKLRDNTSSDSSQYDDIPKTARQFKGRRALSLDIIEATKRPKKQFRKTGPMSPDDIKRKRNKSGPDVRPENSVDSDTSSLWDVTPRNSGSLARDGLSDSMDEDRSPQKPQVQQLSPRHQHMHGLESESAVYATIPADMIKEDEEYDSVPDESTNVSLCSQQQPKLNAALIKQLQQKQKQPLHQYQEQDQQHVAPNPIIEIVPPTPKEPVTSPGFPIKLISLEAAMNGQQGGISDSDDTFFDDASFDTLSDLDAPDPEEVEYTNEPPKRQREANKKQAQKTKTVPGSPPEGQGIRIKDDRQLKKWIAEQAAIVQERKGSQQGPLAQSTPPPGHSAPLQTNSEFTSEHGEQGSRVEKPSPVLRGRPKGVPNFARQVLPPPPQPPSQQTAKTKEVPPSKAAAPHENQRLLPQNTRQPLKPVPAKRTSPQVASDVRYVEINDLNSPGRTVKQVCQPESFGPKSLPPVYETNSESECSEVANINSKVKNSPHKTGSRHYMPENEHEVKQHLCTQQPAVHIRVSPSQDGTGDLKIEVTESSELRVTDENDENENCDNDSEDKLHWEKVSLSSQGSMYWEHTGTEDIYAAYKDKPKEGVILEHDAESEYVTMKSPEPLAKFKKKSDDENMKNDRHVASSSEEEATNSGHYIASSFLSAGDHSSTRNLVVQAQDIYTQTPPDMNESQSPSINNGRFVAMPGAKEIEDRFLEPVAKSVAKEYKFHKSIKEVSTASPANIEEKIVRKMSYSDLDSIDAESNGDSIPEQQEQPPSGLTQEECPVAIDTSHGPPQQPVPITIPQVPPLPARNPTNQNRKELHNINTANNYDQNYVHQQTQHNDQPSVKKVTIGDKEIIHERRKKDFDHRKLIFNNNGKMPITVTGGNSDGIFVHRIHPGSDAEQKGLLEGDQILQVNEQSMKGKTKEEATLLLMGLQGQVRMIVRYRKDRYDGILDNAGMGDSFYIRAYFTYENPRGGEMGFKAGDIMSVCDTLPEGKMGSWKAFKVNARPDEKQHGLIPNHQRAEQLAFAQVKSQQVLQQKTLDKEQRGGFLRRSLRRSKSLEKLNRDKEKEDQNKKTITNVKSYEKVVQQSPGSTRPVVLLGLFADSVRERLIEDSVAFEAPPPEVEMPSAPDAAEEIRLMGRVETIRRISAKDKHCVLIVGPKFVQYLLNESKLQPIVIYLSADNKHVIKQVRTSLAPNFDKRSAQLFEEAHTFEKHFSHLFTATVSFSAGNSWFSLLKDTIGRIQNQPVWVQAPEEPVDEIAVVDMSPVVESRRLQNRSRSTELLHIPNENPEEPTQTQGNIPKKLEQLLMRHAGESPQEKDEEAGFESPDVGVRRGKTVLTYDGYFLSHSTPTKASDNEEQVIPENNNYEKKKHNAVNILSYMDAGRGPLMRNKQIGLSPPDQNEKVPKSILKNRNSSESSYSISSESNQGIENQNGYGDKDNAQRKLRKNSAGAQEQNPYIQFNQQQARPGPPKNPPPDPLHGLQRQKHQIYQQKNTRPQAQQPESATNQVSYGRPLQRQNSNQRPPEQPPPPPAKQSQKQQKPRRQSATQQIHPSVAGQTARSRVNLQSKETDI